MKSRLANDPSQLDDIEESVRTVRTGPPGAANSDFAPTREPLESGRVSRAPTEDTSPSLAEQLAGLAKAGESELVAALAERSQRIEQELSETQARVVDMQHRLQASDQLAHIGRMAVGVAHDFNNALSAVLMHSAVLLRELPANSKVAEDARHIRQGALRAAALCQQLLTSGKPSSAQAQRVYLQSVVAEALELLRAVLPPNIQLRQLVDPSCSPIQGAPSQLHRMIMNLGLNSRDAMADAGGVLRVVLTSTQLDEAARQRLGASRAGEFVVLGVSDCGCGMDPATLERAFEPFFTTKSARTGNGLGLSLVREIVSEHEGVVTIDSRPRQGTTVTAYFPADPPVSVR